MYLYKAAVYSNSYMPGMNRYLKLNDHEKSIVHDLENILESYHYVGKQSFVDHMRNNNAKIFLDSGAFSAWTLGTKIDIHAYCDYIIRNRDILRVEDDAVMASVLDGIGDPQQTYEHQMFMEHLGAKPLPCFHFGEDERYLEFYVKNYSYITLGGMVGKPVPALEKWLDRIWSKYLVDGSGRARIKVHAFGITSFTIMKAYPWFSVDSSSWIQGAAFGSVMTPEFGPVKVSSKSPSAKVAGQHVESVTELEREVLVNLLAKHGFEYERLSEVYESRAAFNLWAYGQLNKMVLDQNSPTLQRQVQELF